MSISEFPQSVIERMNFYVYLLIDPATQKVFYVGKGKENRVFAHARDALESTSVTDKLEHIRKILASGKQVEYIILRHGLTEKEAFEVESALIDYIGLDTLLNEVAGMHSDTRGRMNAVDIIAQYSAPPIDISEPVMLITINRLYSYNMSAEDLYEFTRGNWVVGIRREKAKYALAVFRGIVREVYEIHSWEAVDDANPQHKTTQRWRFNGIIASNPYLRRYVNGSVQHYLTKGSQNPIRYRNC